MAPSITIWNRVEPHRRSDDISVGLRAEVRDPLWLLTRQRQLGELRGEDAGSPAYVRVVSKTAGISDWSVSSGGGLRPLDGTAPLEAVLLAEPHTPDVATQVELAQTFFELLERELLSRGLPLATARTLEARFIARFPLALPPLDPLNPRDRASNELIDLVTGRAADGAAVLSLAQATPIVVPPEITTDPAQVEAAREALADFRRWVAATFGTVGTTDPAGWSARNLEYQVSVGVQTGESRRATLAAFPSPEGELEWSSFDLVSESEDLFAEVSAGYPSFIIPGRVHYAGLPWSRFWRFEDADPSYPNVGFDPPDLLKMVVVDFAMKSGVDWFLAPIPQEVGTIAQLESVIVKDVFGRYTVIDRADSPASPPGIERWTMYSVGSPSGQLASFTIVPPSIGPLAVDGPVLEQVRFARDDNANLAWAIAAFTESAIGEPRPGIERNAAVEATLPAPPPSSDTTSPLRYLLENRVPVQWVPLVPVDLPSGRPELQRGVVALPTATGVGVNLAFAVGKILNPQSVPANQPYRLPDEEVPRVGLRIERVVSRSRWVNGSSHLWVARGRRTGSAETQSSLAFDLALPVSR